MPHNPAPVAAIVCALAFAGSADATMHLQKRYQTRDPKATCQSCHTTRLPKKGDAALNDLGRSVTAATAANGETDWAKVPIASPKGARPSAAPSASAGNGLTGSWHSQDGRESISFAKDGTFQAHLIEQGPSPSPADVSGTYLVDGATIALTVKGRPPMTWRFKIDGKDAVFTYDQGGSVKDDGATAKFSRAR